MEEVVPQFRCVCVCGAVTYLVRVSLTTGLLNNKQKDILGREAHADSLSRRIFSFCTPAISARHRLKRCSRSRSEHYAFRLQAAMVRAVMVGRGPTGARVLVLSILIILTTKGCRAQKGWCHTAAVTTGGARAKPRRHAAMLV